MILIKESQARLLEAKNTSEGMIAMAKAESGAAQKLKVKRWLELEEKRLRILSELAAKGRKIISGKSAENILNQMIDGAKVTTL